MKFVIMGQPRSGKSSLALKLNKCFNIPIICTDKYRREWGYHEPWKNYEAEISPLKEVEFYNRLLELYDSLDDVILEGSAINPKYINMFKCDNYVLLVRKNLSPEEMLLLSRKYDNDWTTKRDDKYLLELFTNYSNYSKKWSENYKDFVIDTSNYEIGLEKAFEKLIHTNNKLENIKER